MAKQKHTSAPLDSRNMFRTSVVPGLILLGLVVVGLIFFVDSQGSSTKVSTNSTIHLVYSPTCPHCHSLINYLNRLPRTPFIDKTRSGKTVVKTLSQAGILWNGGVPLLYAEYNGSVLAISGFPISGRFLENQEYEKTLCLQIGGTAVGGSNYTFCKMPTGMLLGNANSVDYLVNFCLTHTCE